MRRLAAGGRCAVIAPLVCSLALAGYAAAETRDAEYKGARDASANADVLVSEVIDLASV